MLEWMTPRGEHLTTTVLARRGGVVRAVPAPTTITPTCSAIRPDALVQPDVSPQRIKFLIACLSVELGKAITMGCAESCGNCAVAKFNPHDLKLHQLR